MKNLKRNAFSLIELAIVLLVISIIAAAVVQGSRIVRQSKLSAARSLTQSSPVVTIKGLSMWYETTMEDAFATDAVGNSVLELNDQDSVTTWRDRNPTAVKIMASEATNKPKFISDAMNGVPAVRFDGTNDRLALDGSSLSSSYNTIFIVAKNSGTTGYMFGGPAATAGNIGFTAITTLYAKNGAGTAATATVTSADSINVWTFVSSAAGQTFYQNGTTVTVTGGSTSNSDVSNWTAAAIGSDNTPANFFNGDIGEIIIYGRALNTQEIKDINAYLGKKFAVKVAS